jgi:hypothetical protein
VGLVVPKTSGKDGCDAPRSNSTLSCARVYYNGMARVKTKASTWQSGRVGSQEAGQPADQAHGFRSTPGAFTFGVCCPRRYKRRYLDGWTEKDTRAAMHPGAGNRQPRPAQMPGRTAWTGYTVFLESELRNCYEANPDGSMGDYKTAESVFDAMTAGVRKRDYSKIRVPVLAFVGLPASAGSLMAGNYEPKNE